VGGDHGETGGPGGGEQLEQQYGGVVGLLDLLEENGDGRTSGGVDERPARVARRVKREP
jgi:hypothetical protein